VLALARVNSTVMPLPNPLPIIASIIASLLTVLLASAVCVACDCVDLSPPESFKVANLVFIGKAVAVNNSQTESNAIFRVDQVLKGTSTGQGVITSHGTNCDVSFQTGNVYIVYARESDGKLFADTCLNTKPIAAQQSLIHYTSPPGYSYRAIGAGIILLLVLVVGYIVGRAWPRAA
jgi:hypothetical protein